MTFCDAWDRFMEPYRRVGQAVVDLTLHLLTRLLDWLATFVKIV